MANTSRVVGLMPINQPYGGIRVTLYEAATGTAMYMYQPVDTDANGRLIVAVPGSGNFIVGSVVGFLDDASGPVDYRYPYLPANPVSINSAGLVKVLVADDPNQLFLIEENTSGTALDAQTPGNGGNWTYLATTGNTNSGIANVVLHRTGIVAAGSNQQLRIIKKLDKPDNAYGDYCKWIVQPFYHRRNPPGDITVNQLI